MYRICEEEKRNWKYILIFLEAVPQATAVKIQSQDSAECTSPSKVNVTHVEVQCSLVPLPPLKLLTGPTETRTPSKQPGPSLTVAMMVCLLLWHPHRDTPKNRQVVRTTLHQLTHLNMTKMTLQDYVWELLDCLQQLLQKWNSGR
ncbi:uncharacterized protein [Apostichopus japonicus]|uniref:uncharacterized protein n=1 Tax=Stichopus japonicus TaxID=307972 RepID=UPI003AB6F1E2